jgi:hypothetical protein
MGSTGSKLLHDVEVKQQLVTIAAVGVLIISIEAFLYYRILTPEVQRNVARMVDRSPPVLADDPVAQDVLSMALATADIRERVYTRDVNRGTYRSVAGIVLGLVLAIGLLYVGSRPLRRASVKPVLADVAVIGVGIAAFEYVFYRLGHRWQYDNEAEMQHAVADGYLAAAGRASVATSCGGCAETLQRRVEESTAQQRARIRQLAAQVFDQVAGTARERLETEADRAQGRLEAAFQRRLDAVERRLDGEANRVQGAVLADVDAVAQQLGSRAQTEAGGRLEAAFDRRLDAVAARLGDRAQPRVDGRLVSEFDGVVGNYR